MRRISNLKKTLALFLALVMSLSLTVTAVAAESAPATGIGISVTYVDGTVLYMPDMSGSTAAEVAADVGIDLDDYSSGYWMYIYNGTFGTVAASEQKLNDNDVLAFYQVQYYTTDTYALFDDTSVIMDNGWLVAKEGLKLCGMVQNFDMTKPYVHDTALTFYVYDVNEYTAVGDPITTVPAGTEAILLKGSGTMSTVIPVKMVEDYTPYITNAENIYASLKATIHMWNDPETFDSQLAAVTAAANEDEKATAILDLGAAVYTQTGELAGPRLSDASFGGDLAPTQPVDPDKYSYTLYNTALTPIEGGMVIRPGFMPMNFGSVNYTITAAVNGGEPKTIQDEKNYTLETGTTVFTVTLTWRNPSANAGKPASSVYTFTVSTEGTLPSGGTGAYAYLPAPGQFTNEKIGEGGWGDIFAADGNLKNMVGTIATTGVSLGDFGGYVVFDMGKEGIKNDPSHPYGVDFIVYGNAFWDNSEPGCIQVSNDLETWYDIAGSLYYGDMTEHNTSVKYESSKPDDPNQPIIRYIPADANSWEEMNTDDPLHKQPWFPLYENYFAERNGESMAKVAELSDFVEVKPDGYSATKPVTGLIFKNCNRLDDKVVSDTASLGFGYCDVHPQNSGDASVAYNPYQTFTSANDFASKTSDTGGGDPIDISWAVNSDGTPAGLDSIRYVRIYTGTANMDDPFGEISTEVCGIVAVTAATGSGEASVKPEITISLDGDMYDVTDFVEPTEKNGVDFFDLSEVEFPAGTDISVNIIDAAVYINGSAVTTFTSTETTTCVQVITQQGTESPYIALIKLA